MPTCTGGVGDRRRTGRPADRRRPGCRERPGRRRRGRAGGAVVDDLHQRQRRRDGGVRDRALDGAAGRDDDATPVRTPPWQTQVPGGEAGGPGLGEVVGAGEHGDRVDATRRRRIAVARTGPGR